MDLNFGTAFHIMKQQKLRSFPGTQAVHRAFSILKVFTEERPQWALNELYRHLGFTKSTAYRLLVALEKEGLLVRNATTDAYSLGPEIVVLAGRARRSSSLQSASRPELEALAEKMRETASLEVLSGQDVLVVDEVPGERLVTASSSLGTRWPALCTSTGKAMVANLPEAKMNAILRKPLRAYTVKTMTNPEELRKDLAQSRRKGYAVADEQLELGFIAIGAAIHNHAGEPVAAISIGGPTIRLTQDRITQIGSAVRAIAERISLKLGYSA